MKELKEMEIFQSNKIVRPILNSIWSGHSFVCINGNQLSITSLFVAN